MAGAGSVSTVLAPVVGRRQCRVWASAVFIACVRACVLLYNYCVGWNRGDEHPAMMFMEVTPNKHISTLRRKYGWSNLLCLHCRHHFSQ